MSNEEIRDKQPILHDVRNSKTMTCLFEAEEVDAIQNETRKDERERVIKEIEEYIKKANTDLYGVDWVLTKDLLTLLNSLTND
jgi:hypothetical protein